MPLPAFLAFLANPAFWSGVGKTVGSAVGAAASTATSGGGGSSGGQQGKSSIVPNQQQKAPVNLMGFTPQPNYGQIIKEMLMRQRL